MASYLEAYGAAEQHRARVLAVVKNCSIVLAGLLLAGLILFTVYRNHSEERPATNFLGLLRARNYSASTVRKECASSAMVWERYTALRRNGWCPIPICRLPMEPLNWSVRGATWGAGGGTFIKVWRIRSND